MIQLNMLGQPCPIPVIEAKKALALPEGTEVELLVDNLVAVQNLEKMATGTGCTFSYSQPSPNHYTVTICRPGAPLPAQTQSLPTEPTPAEGGLVVLLTGNQMGTGSEDLGKILLKGFLYSLTQLPLPPQTLIFLNSGAHLTTQGANTLPDLQTLAALGCTILTCGTCANFYELTGKLAVGEIADMYTITTRLATAGRLITL